MSDHGDRQDSCNANTQRESFRKLVMGEARDLLVRSFSHKLGRLGHAVNNALYRVDEGSGYYIGDLSVEHVIAKPLKRELEADPEAEIYRFGGEYADEIIVLGQVIVWPRRGRAAIMRLCEDPDRADIIWVNATDPGEALALTDALDEVRNFLCLPKDLWDRTAP